MSHSLELNDKLYWLRIIFSVALGVVVAGFLTWFMYILIQSGDASLNEGKRIHISDFIRVKQNETTQLRKRVPERPKVAKAPPTPEAAQNDDTMDSDVISISGISVDTDLDIGDGLSFGGGDGEYFPIVKVAPMYPMQAASQKIEGICTVIYTVTTTGTVKDVKVIEEKCDHRYFFKPSIKAAYKFKYKPRVIDGVPIEVKDVQNRFVYNLVDR